MDTTKSPTVTIAGPPFNDRSDSADIVIRTADNVHFFVFKALLSLSSPSSFFRHALQASHHTEEWDGLPVLEVKEDSSTFRIMLFFCCPYRIPKIDDFTQLTKVGMALDKYCIDSAVERFIETVLASPVIKYQPVRVFAVSVANGWKELVETAARNTLAMPLEPEVEVEDFRYINALQYFRLREYHRECGNAANLMNVEEWLLKIQLMSKPDSKILHFLSESERCQWCNQRLPSIILTWEYQFFAYDWLNGYLKSVVVQMSWRPWPGIALDDDIIMRAITASTSECGHYEWAKIAVSQIRLLGRQLAEEMEKRISRVPLNMECTK